VTSDVKSSRVAVRATCRLICEKASLLCSVLLFSAWVQGQPAYDALLERARGGDYAPALSFLRAQQANWQSPRYLTDHLLIASWAGEDAEVVALYEQHAATQVLSADALVGVARAYRNLRQWPQALAVYRQGLGRFAGHQGLLQGQIMTLADAGQMVEAISQGRALVAQAPEDAERRLVLGYVYLRDGQRYAALYEIDRAHELAPEHAEVAREYLLSLQRAGLPQQALALSVRYPGLLDAGQVRQLQGDTLAEQVRLAGMATRRESERFQIADRALAEAERLLQAWVGQPQARADSVRVRIDRLGALHARVQMAEVLQQYQQLQAEQINLPAYALRWVASALLYLRQPEQAAELYRQVLAGTNDKHPEWLEDQRGLFYALVESEQMDAAQEQAEQLVASQMQHLYLLGNPEPEPNARWLEAQELRANAHLQANDTPSAEQAFTELADNAPNNATLRTARAGLYLAHAGSRHQAGRTYSRTALRLIARSIA
jgi:biofilm PGA synthesis protein PgaA